MVEETNMPIKAEFIELDRERKSDKEGDRENERLKETDTDSNFSKIFYNHFNSIIFDGKSF